MDEVVRAFEALPEVEQRALALLVALHRPASRSDFTRLLRSADIRRRDGKAFAITELLPILEGWQKGQLVKQDGPGAWAADARSQHALAAHLAERKLLAVAVDRVRELEPMQAPYSVKVSSIVRELFLALYVPRHPNLTAYVNAVPQQHGEQSLHTRAYGLHAPLAVLQRTDAPDAQLYLETTLPLAVADLLPLGEGVLSFVREAGSTFARASAAQYLAMRGQPAQAITGDATDACSHAARAFVALTQDELTRAREHARAAIEQTRARNKRIKGLTHPLWPWVTLLLLTDQAEPSSAALALEQLASCRRTNRQQFEVLQGLEGVQRTLQEAKGARRLDCYPSSSSTWLELVIWQAALTLAEQPPPSQFEGLRQPWLEVARSAGFTWAARALQGLSLASKEAPWERALRALERTLHQSPTSEPAERTERLAWVLETVDGRPRVTPRLQTQRGARFSGGRPISLRRLFEAKSEDPLLDSHDRRVVDHLREVPNPFNPRQMELHFGPETALALIDHPRVFSDVECTRTISVERGQPSLLVQEADDGGWVVKIEPPEVTKFASLAEHVADDRMRVYHPSAEQRAIFGQLPREGLVLPPEAREPARQTLGKLAALFPTSSALELTARAVVELDADPRIHVQLRRLRAGGMRAAFCVAPLPTSARLIPGEGNAILLAPRDGETLRCTRDLEREREELAWLSEALAVDDNVIALSELVDCLEFLARLHELGERVVVEWPEGDPLSIAAQRELSNLQLRVESQNGWLHAEGELKVDDALTLSFRELISRAHERHGRFVQLDGGRFLALSSALQRSIEAAEALARVEAERVALHPLAFLALTQLDDASLEMPPELAARIERARESSGLEPEVPRTFEAELRPYQIEGYRFLHRLAHWQAGACLADDMGLGKTLQTLALLVERAGEGPALVVAPTSVCGNWVDEARRFAPSLRVKRLGAGDRERMLGELGAFDVVVCSYGVLQQERERLGALQFHTAVLDEAQAIKNASTLRAKAAFELKADQRIALTGTPVENHLGELWSILNFVNPGLLGSEREFQQRFVRPIQRDRDRARAQLLRRLVTPFILRRKKSEVLDDLPEKTVITLRVEPSAEERALYAAMSEEARERVARNPQPGQARIQLFAELMRMRRAACAPSLVLADGAPSSSKLTAFEELVQELRDNGHRALVFSQFVDFLSLVRARLDAMGVAYQYLDGSSTPAKRSAAVDAFQRGEGDLFLISLKAGGFGLNLTAADYVIHLDPWWNPAVEDQASDRAHRIGQTRPVTIYRLLMQGSIEEKILALHASKRELADDILEGESRAPFEMDQLLELLAEAHAPRTAASSSVPVGR